MATARELQVKIKKDLLAAKHDDIIERPVLGWLVCLLALVEGNTGVYAAFGEDDMIEWKTWYLEWFDANEKKFPKRHKTNMRKEAEALFDELIENSGSINLEGTKWDVF